MKDAAKTAPPSRKTRLARARKDENFPAYITYMDGNSSEFVRHAGGPEENDSQQTRQNIAQKRQMMPAETVVGGHGRRLRDDVFSLFEW